MREPVEVTQFDIRGQQFKVTVDEHGTFRAKAYGGVYHANTLEELAKTLSLKVSQHRTKINVPYMILTGFFSNQQKDWRFEEMRVTGQHGGNGNWLLHNLVTDEKSQDDSYRGFAMAFKMMSASEQAEGLSLYRAMQAAEQEWRNWQREHSYDPRNDAARAMKEAREQAQA